MFSISHSDDGAFRLEIHGSPSELDPEDARRLRGVLLGLAREVRVSEEDTSSTRSTRPPASAAARPDRSNG